MPDGGRELAVGNVHLFIGAAQAVNKRYIRTGFDVERRRAISGLNLKFAGHALGIEGDRRVGTDIDQTVDQRLFAKVDLCRGSSFVLFNFNGGSALANRDGAVIREFGARLVLNKLDFAGISYETPITDSSVAS